MNVINKGLADINMVLYCICFFFFFGVVRHQRRIQANQNNSFVFHKAVIQTVKMHLREKHVISLVEQHLSFLCCGTLAAGPVHCQQQLTIRQPLSSIPLVQLCK